MPHWLVTGANGNLGKRLIGTLLREDDQTQVTAVVRSERAKSAVAEIDLGPSQKNRLQITVVDYEDVAGIAAAARDCDLAVHLVGILKATKNAPYEQAHQRSCAALCEALQSSGVRHVTYMSIVGSTASSDNACLRSKGEAEDILRAGTKACCVLRVPMVLGEGDYASFALAKRASSAVSFGFRNASLEQPIYAGDVVAAILQAGRLELCESLDLAGPECLSRSELTQRAAKVFNKNPTSLSLPLGLGLALVGVLEAVSANPPVTRAMLEVLDHDDQVDPQAAIDALQLPALTELDQMLSKVLSGHQR